MALSKIPLVRRFLISYQPSASCRSFMQRAETQSDCGLEVTLAVLDGPESRQFFGVPLARRGIQPVWLRIKNTGDAPCRLDLVSIDLNYYSPLEVAGVNHFSIFKRLLGFGALAIFFLPLVFLILPWRLIVARKLNRQMDEFFRANAFRLAPVNSGETHEGFVFTTMDSGNKVVHVRLMRPHDEKEFVFTVSVPGLDADYLRREFVDMYKPDQLIECDLAELRKRLTEAPSATSNAQNTRHGDPVNLVVIGDFATVLGAFAVRWDETETISLKSCWKTVRSFLLGSEYRYAPVSALFLFGRSQDFALQRTRHSVNERMHLRLWATPLRFKGQPVWIGQISRDIGVRFTWRTWNLTTHRVDPDVDEAREYVLQELMDAKRLEAAVYVDGVGACDRTAPRHNLTGDPYYTDGKRAAIVVSGTRTTPHFIAWS
jgi:hypothetical protein